jgi:hypothetical protein
MDYKQLDQDYRDDLLADALYSREVEYFHYDFDRSNFVEMLKHLPKGEYRSSIEKRLAETEEQMRRVSAIYAALETKVVDAEAHERAVARGREKRAAKAEHG